MYSYMYIYMYSVYYEITITTLRQTQALPTFQSKDLKFPVVSGAPNSNSVPNFHILFT